MICARIPIGARVLDVGCGTGSISSLIAAECQARVVGIEPDPERAAACRARGLQVVCGYLDDDTAESLGTFDVILFADVLEHVPDPASLPAFNVVIGATIEAPQPPMAELKVLSAVLLQYSVASAPLLYESCTRPTSAVGPAILRATSASLDGAVVESEHALISEAATAAVPNRHTSVRCIMCTSALIVVDCQARRIGSAKRGPSCDGTPESTHHVVDVAGMGAVDHEAGGSAGGGDASPRLPWRTSRDACDRYSSYSRTRARTINDVSPSSGPASRKSCSAWRERHISKILTRCSSRGSAATTKSSHPVVCRASRIALCEPSRKRCRCPGCTSIWPATMMVM